MGLEKSALDDLRIDRSRTTRRRNLLWLWPALLILGIAVGAAAWWRSRPNGLLVETLVVREAAGQDQKTLLNASGYVVARREATVSSKVTGKVIEVLVEEGLRVQENQILARLDSSNVKTSLDLAQAQLISARSALAETQVRLHAAELELRRVTGLATNRVASESDLDRATADANSWRAHLEQQQADAVVAERQVALWAQQLDDTIIRAPFTGIVVSKNAQPGEMISPISAGGGFTRTGICTLVDMGSLEIEVDVNESYINRVQAGQLVQAVLDAYPEWQIPCKVQAIIPTADRQKATVKVRVAFTQLDPRILPQMGVKVAFQSGVERSGAGDGISIPKSAVREAEGRQIVFVLQNGHAERRAVKVTRTTGDEAKISAGLAVGERVIVNGPAQLKEGDLVQERAR